MENADNEMKTPGFTQLVTNDARLLGKKWGLAKAAKEYEAAFAKIDEDYEILEKHTEAIKAKREDFQLLLSEAKRLEQERFQLIRQRELLEQKLAKHYKMPIAKVRELLQTGGIGLFLKTVGGLGFGGAGALGVAGFRGAATLATRAIPLVAVVSTVAWAGYKYKQHIFAEAAEEEYMEAKARYEMRLSVKKQYVQEKREKLSEKEQLLTNAIYETVNSIAKERMKIAELILGTENI